MVEELQTFVSVYIALEHIPAVVERLADNNFPVSAIVESNSLISAKFSRNFPL